MSTITELYRSDVEHVLAQYELGRLVDFRETIHGIENTNYFVRIETQGTPPSPHECVLTVLEGREPSNRALVVDILEQCSHYGLPAPMIHRTTDGRTFARWHEKDVLLCQRLPGNHVVMTTQRHCGAIGRLLARMHRALSPLETDFCLARNLDWLKQVANTCEDKIPAEDRRLLQRVTAQLNSLLERQDVQSMPQGIIHGDLFRDNVLFNQHGLCGVLDFHHAGVSYWLFDIAVAINDWCWQDQELDPEKTVTLLQEYNAIRRLEPMEYWCFPQFLLYAAVCFWLSRLAISIQDNLPDSFPRKDPQEFAEIVREHLEHPFRIHELAFAS